MKRTPYKVVVEFSSSGDILHAACTCPAGLGLQGKGKCNHIGGVLFAVEDFIERGLQNHPEPLTCTSRLSFLGCSTQPKCCSKALGQSFNKENQVWTKEHVPKSSTLIRGSLSNVTMRVSKNSLLRFKTVYLRAVYFFFMTSSQMVRVPIHLRSLMWKKTLKRRCHFPIILILPLADLKP